MLRECDRPEFNLISTWVRTMDGWKTLELGVVWKRGYTKLPDPLSGFYDRGVTVFSKPNLSKHRYSTHASPIPNTLSVCVAQLGPGQKISKSMLRRFRNSVLERPGCKWKLSHLPPQISFLFPSWCDEWLRVFAGGGQLPPNSNVTSFRLEWGKSPICFVQDPLDSPQGTSWLSFSQPSLALGGRVSPVLAT